MSRPRVLLADDHLASLEAEIALLSPFFDVVGTAVVRPEGVRVVQLLGQYLISSIKAEVKKKISPVAGIFLTSQPM